MVKSVTDKALHTQLLYFKCLFDAQWSNEKLEQDNKRRAEKIQPTPLAREEAAALNTLREQAHASLRLSAYDTVDFKQLFADGSGTAA